MANHFQIINYYKNKSPEIKRLVLLTIIETVGSTYQKAGARALIEPNGNMIGLLSGGCLEHDLAQQAQAVFDHGNLKTVFYDTREEKDAIWGNGLGCLGAIRVMLQRLDATDNFYPLNLLAASYGDTGERLVLLTVVDSSNRSFPVGSSYFMFANQKNYFKDTATVLPPDIIKNAYDVLRLGKAQIKKLALNNGDLTIFIEPVQPFTRLLLIGAGKDAEPLAHYAKSLGWWVTVVDHRAAYINNTHFAETDQLLHLAPQELADCLNLNSFDAAIIMTHNLEFDERYLHYIAESAISVVGLLGPTHRKEKLLKNLGKHAALFSGRLHGPVGLDIGAETPSEIALSIIAGVQAALKNKPGGCFVASFDTNSHSSLTSPISYASYSG
jgi:xanthine dehydrogenase accessory factor